MNKHLIITFLTRRQVDDIMCQSSASLSSFSNLFYLHIVSVHLLFPTVDFFLPSSSLRSLIDHLFLGLRTGFLPLRCNSMYTSEYIYFFSILFTRPYDLMLFLSITLTIDSIFRCSLMFSFLILSLLVTLIMVLNSLISAASFSDSSFFVMFYVSDPYNSIGLRIVVYRIGLHLFNRNMNFYWQFILSVLLFLSKHL